MSNTYFISDLHLQASEQATLTTFLNFLDKKAPAADALYILGDLFEYWIGDDDHNALNERVIEALHRLSQTTPIYFMHGNRDFLIGKQFLKAANCKRLKDPTVINLYGQKILLMHGDLLCTADKKYQRFRRFSRCWLVQKLFLLKSLKKRHGIAARYRQASEHYQANAPENIMDVTLGVAEKYLKKYDCNLLIHGHTHRPAIHQLPDNRTRIVLAAWHEKGNALECYKNNADKLEYKLIYFDNLAAANTGPQ